MNEELILKSTILTLIDRKMKLLAELDMINEELIGAHSILAAIPSIERMKNITLLAGKTCARCQSQFDPSNKGSKFCKECIHKSRQAGAQKRWKETGKSKLAIA